MLTLKSVDKMQVENFEVKVDKLKQCFDYIKSTLEGFRKHLVMVDSVQKELGITEAGLASSFDFGTFYQSVLFQLL